jgi:hypothetical protein
MLLAKVKSKTQHALPWILPSSSMVGNFNPLSPHRCSIFFGVVLLVFTLLRILGTISQN